MIAGIFQSAKAAQSVTLEWDADPDPDVAGYRLYYGTQSGVYDHTISVDRTTTATLTDLKRRSIYYVVIVAFDTRGFESFPSNEVAYNPADQGGAVFASYRGGYTGSLVEGSGGKNASVSVQLTGEGTFTGRVFLGNTVARFRGQFGLDASATVRFISGKEWRWLILRLDPQTGRLSAIIPGANGEIDVALSRIVSPKVASPQLQDPARYLMLLGQLRSVRSASELLPVGAAFARATISDSGAVRTTGKLADGQRFAATSHVDELGGFDIYALPYKSPRGILAGRVQLEESAGSGAGTLWWFKPPQAKGRDRRGFEGLVTVAISGLVNGG